MTPTPVTPEGICAIVKQFVENEGVANSLCVKIEHESAEAFINEVQAQTGQNLTPEQAQLLTDLANQL